MYQKLLRQLLCAAICISISVSGCQNESALSVKADVGTLETGIQQNLGHPVVDPVQQYIIYVRPETHTLYFVDADFIPVWGQKIPALVIDFDHAATAPGIVTFEQREVNGDQLRVLLKSDMQGLQNILDQHGSIGYRFAPLF